MGASNSRLPKFALKVIGKNNREEKSFAFMTAKHLSEKMRKISGT